MVYMPFLLVATSSYIRCLSRPYAVIAGVIGTCGFSYAVLICFELANILNVLLIRYIPLVVVITASTKFITSRKHRQELVSFIRIALPAFFISALFLISALTRRESDHSKGLFHSMAVRYWHSIDNQIPVLFSKVMHNEISREPFMFADWKSSDRPPLASGWLTALRIFTDSESAMLICLVLVLGLAVLLVVVVVAECIPNSTIATGATLIVVSTPLVFLNLIYTWPKILAGALILVALIKVIQGIALTQLSNTFVISSLIAFAILSHGSAVFGAIWLLLYVLFSRGGKTFLKVSVISTCIYTPWLLYQRYIDPPGSRLLYYQFTNSPDLSNTRPLLKTLISDYRDVGFQGVIVNKVTNFANLFFPVTRNNAMSWSENLWGYFLNWQALSIAGSLGLPLLAMLVTVFHPKYRSVLTTCTWLREVFIFGACAPMLTAVILLFGRDPESVLTTHVSPLSAGLSLVFVIAISFSQLPFEHQVVSRVGIAALLVAYLFFAIIYGPRQAEGVSESSFSLHLAALGFVMVLLTPFIVKSGVQQLRESD